MFRNLSAINMIMVSFEDCGFADNYVYVYWIYHHIFVDKDLSNWMDRKINTAVYSNYWQLISATKKLHLNHYFKCKSF